MSQTSQLSQNNELKIEKSKLQEEEIDIVHDDVGELQEAPNNPTHVVGPTIVDTVAERRLQQVARERERGVDLSEAVQPASRVRVDEGKLTENDRINFLSKLSEIFKKNLKNNTTKSTNKLQYTKLKERLLDIMNNLETISMTRNTNKNGMYTQKDKGRGIALDLDTLVTYDHKTDKELFDEMLKHKHKYKQLPRYTYRSIYQEIMKQLLSEGNSLKISDFQSLMKSNKINEELLYILMNNYKEELTTALDGRYAVEIARPSSRNVSRRGGRKTKKAKNNKTNKIKHLKTRYIKRSKKNKTRRR